MRIHLLLLAMLSGCLEVQPVDHDVEPAGCPVLSAPDAQFGKACSEAAYPAVTVCHGDDGWCVDGGCRPMCADVPLGCQQCAVGEPEFTDRGACFCR